MDQGSPEKQNQWIGKGQVHNIHVILRWGTALGYLWGCSVNTKDVRVRPRGYKMTHYWLGKWRRGSRVKEAKQLPEAENVRKWNFHCRLQKEYGSSHTLILVVCGLSSQTPLPPSHSVGLILGKAEFGGEWKHKSTDSGITPAGFTLNSQLS